MFFKTAYISSITALITLSLSSCLSPAKRWPNTEKANAAVTLTKEKKTKPDQDLTKQTKKITLATHSTENAPAAEALNATDTLKSLSLSEHQFKKQDFIVFTLLEDDLAHFSLLSHDIKKAPLHNLKTLSDYITNEHSTETLFAMNAGMFEKDFSPAGLWIQNSSQLNPINRKNDPNGGNFYIPKNGVFSINQDLKAMIQARDTLKESDLNDIKWATQSGPMLVIDGKVRPFKTEAGKTNQVIRNAVATCKVQKENAVIFVISKQKINFPDFAEFFTNHLKCDQALFLDGTVSQILHKDHPLKKDDTQNYAGFIVVTQEPLEFNFPNS